MTVKANDDTKNEHKSMPTSSAPVHISTAENRSQMVQIKTSTDQKLLYGAKSLVYNILYRNSKLGSTFWEKKLSNYFAVTFILGDGIGWPCERTAS